MHILGALSLSLLALGAVCAPIDERFVPGYVAGRDMGLDRSLMQAAGCSTASATLPHTGNGAELPAPSSNLKIKYITLGVGTQNYTCENLGETAAPALVGAVASLYDVSCLATKVPWYLDMFSRMAANIPTQMAKNMVSGFLGAKLEGQHYFSGRVPMFDLRQTGQDYAYVSVAAKVPAPESRDVDWLRLNRVDGSGVEIVYRVKTTAGRAPTTCKGMPAQFQVKYLAQYWMYG